MGQQTATPGESVVVVPAASRPDLFDAIPGLLSTRWPTFMLAGHPGHDADVIELLMRHPSYQFLLTSTTDGQLRGAGLALPLTWDGKVEGLPTGWDAAITACAELTDQQAPNTLCILSITITAEHSGKHYSDQVMRQMRAAAAANGLDHVIAPTRPVGKLRYPLTPIERYLSWRTPEGLTFDPWIRRHEDLGGTVLGIATPSMTITGTVGEWEEWLGMALPDSGEYIIRGGLEPLVVDRPNDFGVYREANLWFSHDELA